MMNGKKIKLTRCNKIILLKALGDYYYRCCFSRKMKKFCI